MAEVQLSVATQGQPLFRAETRSSKAVARGPVVSQPERKVSVTA
jgi:hypothetical protein